MPSRRELLKASLPLGWVPEAARKGNLHLSNAGKVSLVKDIALFFPGLAACSSTASPKVAPPVTPDRTFPEGATVPGANERLVREISGMPESPIKRAIIDRVLPYYQQAAPFTVNRSGLEFTVYGAGITQKRTRNTKLVGTSAMHGVGVLPKDGFHAVEKFVGRIPLPNIIKEDEIASVPPSALAPDKQTLLIDFTVTEGAFVPAGIYPEITITTPYREFIRPDNRAFYEKAESFAFIKEACSLLFADILFEEMYKKAEEIGLPTRVKVEDTKGNLREVEVLTGFYAASFEKGNADKTGRTRALVDIAGYVIALKALEKTSIASDLWQDERYRGAIGLLPNIDLGDTPHSIWATSLYVALRNTELQKVDYQGDLTKVP